MLFVSNLLMPEIGDVYCTKREKDRSTRKISDRVDYPSVIQFYTGNKENMVSRIDSLVSPKKEPLKPTTFN